MLTRCLPYYIRNQYRKPALPQLHMYLESIGLKLEFKYDSKRNSGSVSRGIHTYVHIYIYEDVCLLSAVASHLEYEVFALVRLMRVRITDQT